LHTKKGFQQSKEVHGLLKNALIQPMSALEKTSSDGISAKRTFKEGADNSIENHCTFHQALTW